MKASVFSGILLIVVAALVLINAAYVRHVTDTVLDMLSRLPDGPSEAAVGIAEEILSYLQDKETLLSLSVPYQTLDRSIELAGSLREYASMGSHFEYTATKALLTDAIKDMGRLEKVSLKNVF